MAEYENKKIEEGVQESGVEATDRGLFDFLGKKKEEEEKPHVAAPEEEVVVVTEHFEKVEVSEPPPPVHKVEEEEKKPSLLEKLTQGLIEAMSCCVPRR